MKNEALEWATATFGRRLLLFVNLISAHARRPQTLTMYLLFDPPLRVKLRRFELPRNIPPYCGDIRKAVFEQWIHQQNTSYIPWPTDIALG